MKQIITIIAVLSFLIVNGQTTAIPDPNFEQALIDLGYDTGTPNGSVPTANISSITDLWVSSYNIADLTGIEDFAALDTLDCYNNQLASLDLSQNTALTYLDCNSNLLTSLDLSQNTALTYLSCYFNLLTCLNTKNGNWNNMDIDAIDNNLTCVEVDNIGYATNNWDFDSFTTINTNCNYPSSCFANTGLEEHSSSLNLYPNPFTTSTTIELPSEPHILTIYDIIGNKVRTEQVSGKTIIERGGFTKGMYIIELRSESQTYESKIVIN